MKLTAPLSLALVVALAGASTADARGPRDGRPWGRGTLMPTVGLGAGFSQDLSLVSIGLGASYFVANGLAFGLGVSDTIFIFSRSLRATYPGIEDQVSTNMLRVMPSLQYVFWRSRWFSPYVFGGVGPVFLNHGGGTVGEWNAGPGAFIGLGGPVYLDLGVGFSARFPTETCNDAFYYDGPDAAGLVLDACSFRWGPRIGLVLAFGGGGGGGRSRRAPAAPPRATPQTWEEPAPIETWEEPAPAPEGPEPPPAEASAEPTSARDTSASDTSASDASVTTEVQVESPPAAIPDQ